MRDRRRSRAAAVLSMLVLGAALLLAPGDAAAAALPATHVSLTTVPPASAASGATVTMAGSVTNGVRRQRVQLQLRNGGGWTTVAEARLPRRRTFSLSTSVFLGVNDLRVVAKKVAGKVRGSTSAVRTTNGLPVAPSSVGSGDPFEVTGRLASEVARPVRLEADTGSWDEVARGTSGADGAVSLSTRQTRTTSYRIVAPEVTIAGVRYPAVTTKPVKVLKGTSAPYFDVTTLPRGYRNHIYNYFGFTWRAGWVFSVASGALPPGIELTADGYLDGTPTAAGTWSFTVRIAATGQPSVQRTFTLEVVPNGVWLADDGRELVEVDAAGRYAAVAPEFPALTPRVLDLATGEVRSAPTPPQVPAEPEYRALDISGNGRHLLYEVATSSFSSSSVRQYYVYLWDRVGGTTTQVVQGSGHINAHVEDAHVTADGSAVAYVEVADDLNDNGDLDEAEIYVWERGGGTRSLAQEGFGAGRHRLADISDDGTTLAWVQIDGVTGAGRIRVWDRTTDATWWASAPVTSSFPQDYVWDYEMSSNGASVVFARLLGRAANDDGIWETVLWDRATQTSQVVSETISGAPMLTLSEFDQPVATVSGDGRFVFFDAKADFFEEGFVSPRHVYFWDRLTGDVVRTPLRAGAAPDQYRWAEPSTTGGVLIGWGESSGSGRSGSIRFQLDLPR